VLGWLLVDIHNIKRIFRTTKEIRYENSKKDGVHFTSFGSDNFTEKQMNIIEVILGDKLMEFYYEGNNTQFIYFNY